MDLKLNNFKGKINLREWLKGIGDFLNRKSRWILLIFFLALLGYCACLWYNSIIDPRWSENRKQAYISARQNPVIFNKDKFDAVIEEIEGRKNEYQKNIEGVADIFRLKQ